MIVATVMSYPPGTNYSVMCRAWAYMVRRYNPNARIVVFYATPDPWVLDYVRDLGNAEFHKMDLGGVLTAKKATGYTLEGMEYKLGLWSGLQDAGIHRVIYVDADAFVLHPLDTLWNISEKQTYAASYEGDYNRLSTFEFPSGGMAPHHNAGVFTYNAKLDFEITYDLLAEQYVRDQKISWMVGDQGLLNAALARLGYCWCNQDMGFEWNTMAWTSEIERVDDDEIIAWTPPGPAPVNKKEGPNWRYWGQKVRSKIHHAFWKKWWTLPETAKLWEYVQSKVNHP